MRLPRRALRRARRRHLDSEPGPCGTAIRPCAGVRQGARDLGVEELQRREAAGERQTLLRGGQLQRRGDAPRAVERAREPGLEPARRAPPAARSRAGPNPPLPASFTLTTSHAPSSAARSHVVGGRGSARRPRSALDLRAHLGELLERARTAARPARGRSGASASMRRDRLVGRPGAVRVDPQRGPRADRLAHGRDALGVIGQADLQLEARVAVAEPLGGRARRPPRAARPAACG